MKYTLALISRSISELLTELLRRWTPGRGWTTSYGLWVECLQMEHGKADQEGFKLNNKGVGICPKET